MGIRVANLMRPMDLLYAGVRLPTLPGLINMSDMSDLKNQLETYSSQMQVSPAASMQCTLGG
jgi:hypothetical protein